MKNHKINTSAVHGSVKAQYIQNVSCTTLGLSHCSDGTAKRAAKKVAGKNAIVIMAIVFIAVLSFFESCASRLMAELSLFESSASCLMAELSLFDISAIVRLAFAISRFAIAKSYNCQIKGKCVRRSSNVLPKTGFWLFLANT
jgi:hypothetical protein